MHPLIHSFHICALCQSPSWALREQLGGIGGGPCPWKSPTDGGGRRRLQRLRGGHVAGSLLCGDKEGFLWEVPCHKEWGYRQGTEVEGRPSLQSRGHRDSITTCDGLICSPEFVKPCPEGQGCLCVFFYFSTGAKDKKLMSGHHSARPEEPLHSEAEGRSGRRNTRRTGQSNKRARNLRTPSPILHCGARREWCASPTAAPRCKEAQQPGLSSAGSGAQCPSGS